MEEQKLTPFEMYERALAKEINPPLSIGKVLGTGCSGVVHELHDLGIPDENGTPIRAVIKRYMYLYMLKHTPRATAATAATAAPRRTSKQRDEEEQYRNEVNMYTLVRDLYYRFVSPNIVLSSRVDSSYDMVLEQCDTTLFKFFIPRTFHKLMARRIQCLDWYCAIFQVIHVLAVLQESYQFMHHDLHAANVFIKVLDDSFEWHSCTAKHGFIPYRVGDTQFHLPMRGFLIKLGDFNLACAFHPQHRIRYSRIDRGNYRSYGIDGKYHRGYDMQVFLLGLLGFRKELFMPNEVRYVVIQLLEMLVPNNPSWWKDIIKKDTTKRYYRPTLATISNVSPDQVFASNLFHHMFYHTR